MTLAPRAPFTARAQRDETATAGRGHVAEDLAPVFDGAVRREDGAHALVAAHHEFQQVFGGGGGQFAHAEVVDDEQRCRRELVHLCFALAEDVDVGPGKLDDDGVGFAVDDAVAGNEGGVTDGLSEVALASAGGPRSKTSSRALTNFVVANSKMVFRFIFLLKSKSKVSMVLPTSRNAA